MKNWSTTKKILVLAAIVIAILVIANWDKVMGWIKSSSTTRQYRAGGEFPSPVVPRPSPAPRPIVPVRPVVINPTIVTTDPCQNLALQIKALRNQMSSNASMEQKVQLANLIKQYTDTCVTSQSQVARGTGNAVNLPLPCGRFAKHCVGKGGTNDWIIYDCDSLFYECWSGLGV